MENSGTGLLLPSLDNVRESGHAGILAETNPGILIIKTIKLIFSHKVSQNIAMSRLYK
jgi:hypothetical protein